MQTQIEPYTSPSSLCQPDVDLRRDDELALFYRPPAQIIGTLTDCAARILQICDFLMTATINQHMKERATIICEQDRHILLVRKPRSRWTLPGGKVERGETKMNAAARELQEETGLDAEDLLYLMELETGSTRHHVYEASVLNIDDARPQNEIFDCIWHPLDAVQNLNINEATLRIVQAFQRRL
jgi:8-oxo-dGTP diphosphatase